MIGTTFDQHKCKSCGQSTTNASATHNIAETSVPTDPTEREAAFARIQQEMAASEAVTRAWKRRHNEFSLISRLPDELFSTIFKMNRDDWALFTPKLTWTGVSHVCSHWRRVALGCPSLWTEVLLHFPKWAEEMLVRSKMAPLKISAFLMSRLTRPHVYEVLVATLKQSFRIQELRLEVPFRGYTFMAGPAPSDIFKLLSGPIPLLEICEIKFQTSAAADNKLPATWFSGSPLLRHLTLSGCGLDWGSPVFANLTLLSVSDIPEIHRPPIHEVLFALSYMPRLESLTLFFNFTSINEMVTPNLVVATLPYLQTLTVRCGLQDCVILLDYIEYSNKAKVDISPDITANMPSPHEMIQKLSVQLEQRMLGGIISLKISTNQSPSFQFKNGTFIEGSGLLPQVNLCLRGVNRLSQPYEAATSVLQGLPLQWLQQINACNCKISSANWLLIFGNLPRLEAIRIEQPCHTFLQAFSTGTNAFPDQNNENSVMKFRALRSLTAVGWNFYMRNENKSCIQILSDSLKQRREKGVILTDLKLEYCRHVNNVKVENLKKVVEHVQWDEIEFSNPMTGDADADEDSVEDEDEEDEDEEDEDYDDEQEDDDSDEQ